MRYALFVAWLAVALSLVGCTEGQNHSPPADIQAADAAQEVRQPTCPGTPACIPGQLKTVDADVCGKCGASTYVCSPECQWEFKSCVSERDCNPGETLAQGTCGWCGEELLECGDHCYFLYKDCVNQGSCAPGTNKIGGECGGCGQEHFSCNDQCQWEAPECVEDEACKKGETRTQGTCGKCGTAVHECIGDCEWEQIECKDEGECVPGETENTPDPCGFCGYWRYECDEQCMWEPAECLGQGACEPGTYKNCGNCGGHTKCQANCQWEESCIGEVTVAVFHAEGDTDDEQAAIALQEELALFYGPLCVDRFEMGGPLAAKYSKYWVAQYSASIFVGNQCSWSPATVEKVCNGAEEECGASSNWFDDVWGDYLSGPCALKPVGCKESWLVQKGLPDKPCVQVSGNCVFNVVGFDKAGQELANDAFISSLAEHPDAPCAVPQIEPSCLQICATKCGWVGECYCGGCGPCQDCTVEKECLTNPDVGTSCSSWGGCNECVDGEVGCVGKFCSICTNVCEDFKKYGVTIGCGIAALKGCGVACAWLAPTGPVAATCVAVCGAVALELCKSLIDLGAEMFNLTCEDSCHKVGICPEEPCFEEED